MEYSLYNYEDHKMRGERIFLPNFCIKFSMRLAFAQFIIIFLQETNVEIGETAPRDLWMPKPLDFSHWYFHHDDQPKLLTLIEGSSVDITKHDPTDTKSEFVSDQSI